MELDKIKQKRTELTEKFEELQEYEKSDRKKSKIDN